jgi:hypothetical protein
MTTAHDIDWPQLLAERLTTTHPDVLRELLATFIRTVDRMAEALNERFPSGGRGTGLASSTLALRSTNKWSWWTMRMESATKQDDGPT